MKTLVLTIEDIRGIVDRRGLDNLMDELIRRLTEGLMKFDEKKLVIPPRSGFAYDQPDTGLLEWMPILKLGEKATFKMVGYHPTNPAKHKLPTIVSSISTFNTANGHLEAVADATFLTALRTGAASAVASKLSGNPASRIIGLIGCGAQAVSQLHALSRVFTIEKVLAFDIDGSVSRSFIERTQFLGLDVKVSGLGTLVSQSDIISSATSIQKGKGPVFQDRTVKPWLHINAVGSDFPGKFEIPVKLLKRGFVFPDFMSQAIVEGECQQLEPDDIGPDLSHIVKHHQDFLHLKDEITIFDSTGWALEDQLAMEMMTEWADRFGLGTMVQLESLPDDPKNPYDFLGVKTRKTTPEDRREKWVHPMAS